eukprot:PhM_4_TR4973/c0_g1_i2/m.84280
MIGEAKKFTQGYDPTMVPPGCRVLTEAEQQRWQTDKDTITYLRAVITALSKQLETLAGCDALSKVDKVPQLTVEDIARLIPADEKSKQQEQQVPLLDAPKPTSSPSSSSTPKSQSRSPSAASKRRAPSSAHRSRPSTPKTMVPPPPALPKISETVLKNETESWTNVMAGFHRMKDKLRRLYHISSEKTYELHLGTSMELARRLAPVAMSMFTGTHNVNNAMLFARQTIQGAVAEARQCVPGGRLPDDIEAMLLEEKAVVRKAVKWHLAAVKERVATRVIRDRTTKVLHIERTFHDAQKAKLIGPDNIDELISNDVHYEVIRDRLLHFLQQHELEQLVRAASMIDRFGDIQSERASCLARLLEKALPRLREIVRASMTQRVVEARETEVHQLKDTITELKKKPVMVDKGVLKSDVITSDFGQMVVPPQILEEVAIATAHFGTRPRRFDGKEDQEAQTDPIEISGSSRQATLAALASTADGSVDLAATEVPLLPPGLTKEQEELMIQKKMREQARMVMLQNKVKELQEALKLMTASKDDISGAVGRTIDGVKDLIGLIQRASHALVPHRRRSLESMVFETTNLDVLVHNASSRLDDLLRAVNARVHGFEEALENLTMDRQRIVYTTADLEEAHRAAVVKGHHLEAQLRAKDIELEQLQDDLDALRARLVANFGPIAADNKVFYRKLPSHQPLAETGCQTDSGHLGELILEVVKAVLSHSSASGSSAGRMLPPDLEAYNGSSDRLKTEIAWYVEAVRRALLQREATTASPRPEDTSESRQSPARSRKSIPTDRTTATCKSAPIPIVEYPAVLQSTEVVAGGSSTASSKSRDEVVLYMPKRQGGSTDSACRDKLLKRSRPTTAPLNPETSVAYLSPRRSDSPSNEALRDSMLATPNTMAGNHVLATRNERQVLRSLQDHDGLRVAGRPPTTAHRTSTTTTSSSALRRRRSSSGVETGTTSNTTNGAVSVSTPQLPRVKVAARRPQPNEGGPHSRSVLSARGRSLVPTSQE